MKEIELINKRKPREKHFLQEDGTIIAKIYDSDIHYLKNGKYEEIDNTLVKENNCYCNKCNSYKVKYFEDKKQTLMRVEKNKYFLEISLKEANALKIKKTNSTKALIKDVLYEEVLDGIDIEYKTLSNKVKETVVLHNNKYKDINFIINTNLKLKQKDKVIEIYDDIKCVFKFDKPFMQDSKGEYNYNITYELIENNSNYELKLKLDDEWLKSSETIYPVYIDPTISSIGEEVNLYDTYIYQGDTNAERYNEEFLKAGVEQKNNENIINRTLIKFDLPEIGTGSNIISAYLQLVPYPTMTEYPTERIATLHRITEDWNDTTATWDSMNNKFDSHIENIYYLQRSTISNNTIMPGFISDGDITNLVKKWYSDTPNYGLMIKSANEENYIDDDYPMFYSKDNNVQGDYNPKPVVSIVYRNENGIENHLDYKTQSFSNGSALINTNNGNLTTIFNIGNTVGGNLPINLGLVYNTNDVILQKSGKFGIGYKLTFEQTLKTITIDSNNYLEYLDEDGTIHYLYKEDSSEEYYDEEGLGLKVSKSDNICTMTDSIGSELTFTKLNDIYYLTKIQDCDNNFIDVILNNDNSINKLVDRFGSSITIAYNETYIEINSPSSSSKLNYADGLLTSIESEYGITLFTYNEQKLINSITDVTGIKMVYDYYDKKPHKVKKVTQHGLNNEEGQFFLLEYGYNTTKITDNKGRIETIIYDAAGNVASKNSMSSNEDIETAYSITQAVGDSDSGDKNKILSSVIPVRYIKNYLKNTSFEQDVDYFTYDSGITKEYSLEEFCSGYRSLKLTSIIENQSIEQSINVSKGKHYTFSGFFKTNVTSKITLSYTNSNNEVVISSKELESANEFERDDITIDYDENATSDLKIKITLQGIGTIYIDDLQLEEGEVANGYNIIENSDFSEGLSDWTIEGWTFDESEIVPSNYYETIKFNNNKNTALKISMNPLIGTRIYKELPIKGKKDDLYTISFWYKNEGIPNYADLIGNSVTIYFKPINGEAEYCVLSSGGFNINENMWQYFSLRGRAVEDYESIRIIFSNGRQANNLYITNLSFYKELTSGDYQYDNNGNLISSTDQSQNKCIFTYNQNNELVSASNLQGATINYEYDKESGSKIINSISPLGITNATSYDEVGNPTYRKTVKRIITSEILPGIYKIRSKGTKKYIKSEMNVAILEENDCSNTLWKLEQANDKYKICYALHPNYSISCNQGQVIQDKTDDNNLFYLDKNEDGSYHIKFVEETSEGEKIWFLIANSNNILEAKTYEEENDDFKFYIESQEELFLEQTSKYTDDGRFLSSVVDSNFNEIIYDMNQTTGLIEKITFPTGDYVEYTHNEKKLIESIKCNTKEIKYEYNDSNLITKVTQDNKVYQIHYDNFLNPIKTTLNNDITFITNTYGANNDKVIMSTYGNGATISYSYDDFNRIKTIIKNNKIYAYKYDNNGNLSKIITDDDEIRYLYDKSNRLHQFKNKDLTVKLTYDNDGDIVGKTYKLSNISNSQQNSYINGMLNSITDGSTSISYGYDSLNRKITKNVNDLYIVNTEYLTYGKRTTDLIKSYTINNDKYSYEYDKLGNITDIYLNGTIIKHYDYDINNELIHEINYDQNTEINYSYDSKGNMLTKSIISNDTNTTDSYTFNYENTKWEDQLTKFNGYNIEYDSIGNPTKINDAVLTWQNGRELCSYTNDETVITYNYDINGIRTSKIVNGNETKYHLIGTNIIYEERNNKTIYYIYENDGVIGLEYDGMRYYYLKNLQNDIIGIIDTNGNQIVKYKYDSWGKLLKVEDGLGNEITDTSHIGLINPFRYRSYYYDQETKLYYLNSRYYNPEWCRFISPDSLIGINQDVFANNLYLYVSNNPINNIDQDGQFIISAISLGKKLGKSLKKGLKKLVKEVKKVISIKSSITNTDNLDVVDYIGRISSITISNEEGYTTSYNKFGRKDALITLDSNISTLLEPSATTQINTSIGSIAFSVGVGVNSVRIESSTNAYKGRQVFEYGTNAYSAYVLYGMDGDLSDNTVKFDYTRVTISYLSVALAILFCEVTEIKLIPSLVNALA